MAGQMTPDDERKPGAAGSYDAAEPDARLGLLQARGWLWDRRPVPRILAAAATTSTEMRALTVSPVLGRGLLPAVLSLVGGVCALGLLVWLPSHLVGEHQLGPQLQPGRITWWLVAGVLLAQSVLVFVMARIPAGALVVIAGLPLLLVLAPVPPLGLYTLSAIAEMTGVFLAATLVPLRGLRTALVLAGSLIALGQLLNGFRGGGSFTAASVGAAVGQAVVVLGLPLLIGALVAARRAVEEASRRQLAAVRGEQDALLAAAISRQRITMSRELHDIAAHHLSGIAMLAAAIGRQVDTDPAAAKASAAQVREQSRSVLVDLRRLVGLLREDAEAARPVETIDALTALVRDRRAAGADIELTMTASAERRAVEVGPLGQLVVHRMVQESLSNAAAHAPGATCTVGVDAVGRDLEVVVGNAAAETLGPEVLDERPGSGFGLVGMAERAQLVGGALSYGPTEAGGWYVRLTVPFDDAPTAPLGSGNGAAGATELQS